MNDIKKIVENYKDEYLKQKYYNSKKLFEVISNYILKKELIIYGGYALNLVFPKNKKFYKSYTLADYDCYSYNAKKDAIKIAKELRFLKYKMIKVKHAAHPNTYKVYVGRTNVLDVTQISKKLFDILKKIHREELKTKLLRYYKEKYIIVPCVLLVRNLHYELARPEGSSHRWEKIYNRLNIYKKFNKIDNEAEYKNSYIPIPKEYNNLIENVLNYIKKEKNPIIDSYAIKLYKNIKDPNCCRNRKEGVMLMILTNNLEKTNKNIMEIINNTLDKKTYNIINKYRIDDITMDILNKRHRIDILNTKTKEKFNLISIINTEHECFSIKEIGGYSVGSIDTILCFLYSYYITYKIYKYISFNNNTTLSDTNDYIYMYEKYLKTMTNIKDRLSTKCYGKEIGIDEYYKKNWGKQLSIVKYS
jgi:hypothetical protein